MNYINEYQDVPITFLDLSLGEETRSPFLSHESDNSIFNHISSKTYGQSITISNNSSENDVVLMMSGKTVGSLGYGSCYITIDLGENVSLRSAIVSYNLFPNTGGKWQIGTSSDGCNYDVVPTKYNSNGMAIFDKKYCRYIRFYASIYSGLSYSNEEEYEDIPTPGVPSIQSITINYFPEKR